MSDREAFEAWAKEHLGQGYSLEWDDGSYVHPVTRWCFKGYLAGLNQERDRWARAIGVHLEPITKQRG